MSFRGEGLGESEFHYNAKNENTTTYEKSNFDFYSFLGFYEFIQSELSQRKSTTRK